MAAKEGNISVGYDKQLAKNVININGTTSASNYIQVPPLKNIQRSPLGLTGKYIYVVLNAQAGKHFVMHFAYTI
jgi:hypothetical protein